jgi:hypothetical protein
VNGSSRSANGGNSASARISTDRSRRADSFLAEAPGFQPERILVVRVTKFQPGRRVERAATLTVFHEQVLSRLRALPGVSSAGGASGVPYLGTEVDREAAFVHPYQSRELAQARRTLGRLCQDAAHFMELL